MLSNIILTSIYVLALQDNKYFISKLSKEKGDMLDSFISNLNKTELHSVFGNGAYWIQLYPIIKVDKIIEEEKDEYDDIVKYYMASYGAHNVRGGSFTDIVFKEDRFRELVRELNKNYRREHLEGSEYDLEQKLVDENQEHELVEENQEHELVDENQEHELVEENQEHELVDENQEQELVDENQEQEYIEQNYQHEYVKQNHKLEYYDDSYNYDEI